MDKNKFKSKKMGSLIANATKKAVDGGNKAASVVKGKVVDSKQAMQATLDVNGDGTVDIVDIIILAMKTPGIKIDRELFLKKEFTKHFSEEVISKAITTTPSNAGISTDKINEIADHVIQYERQCVSGISAALGAPGGAAMVATLPADIVQYYGYMLRATQKILYLYGFQQIDLDGVDDQIDSETLNTIILCLGVMYGVAGANNALKAMAKALAKGVSQKFMKTAVTKGVVYPVIKSTFKWFGVNLTKKMCTSFFSKAIPVVGGVVGGALTYATFKPCCQKLKNTVQDTYLTNSNHRSTVEEDEMANAILDAVVLNEEECVA